MRGLILLGLVVVAALLTVRVSGFWRGVIWTCACLGASMMYRGGRVMVLPLIFVLLLQAIYWLALPPPEGDGSA